MPKKKGEKQREVERLHQELLQVSTLVLSTFTGLTVAQDSELRRAVRSAGGRYKVLKNTLAERAARETPAAPLLKGLKGVNSIAYTAGDAVALAKALSKYAKENPAFTFRSGLVEGAAVDLGGIQSLASLPSRQEVYARLLGVLQAPAQRLAVTLAAAGRNLAMVVNQGAKENKFRAGD